MDNALCGKGRELLCLLNNLQVNILVNVKNHNLTICLGLFIQLNIFFHPLFSGGSDSSYGFYCFLVQVYILIDHSQHKLFEFTLNNSNEYCFDNHKLVRNNIIRFHPERLLF